MKNPGKSPSRWCYLIGASLMVLALVTCGVLFVILIESSVPDTRFVVPGTHEAYLQSRGEYTVYYEYSSVFDGEIYATGPYPSSIVPAD